MKSLRFALLLTVALLGCSSPPQSVDSPAGLTAEDETAIRSVGAEFDRAFAANRGRLVRSSRQREVCPACTIRTRFCLRSSGG